MAITLGLVEAIDSNGVYVSMPGSRGVLRGPYETLQNVTAGDKVLMVATDDGENVIIGLAGATVPGVSIPDGSITSAKIANDTIVNEDVNASAAIDKTKISGTAITAADSGTVTSTMIADGTIVNADINASAAIDKTKVSGTAITAADTGTVTNAMLAGSIAASKITGTAITAADSGTVTSTMIANSTIVDGDISGSAAISRSKISGLPTSSTDNTLPRFDSTAGALQTSSVVVDDSNNISTTGVVSAANVTGYNWVINGAFDVNQRAFTSVTADGAFSFDRWRQSVSGGTLTTTPQTFTLGTTADAESRNYVQLATASHSAVGHYAYYSQRIESVRTLAGQSATISFWAKATSGTPKIAVEVTQSFGTGGSPSADVNTAVSAVTLSTSWARYSVTVSVPSISGKTIGTSGGDYLSLNLWLSGGSTYNSRASSIGNQNATFHLWGVKVEKGGLVTPFGIESYGDTLRKCWRYYWRTNAVNAYTYFSEYAPAASTTVGRGIIPMPAPLRVYPTVVDYLSLALDDGYSSTVALNAAPTIKSWSTPEQVVLDCPVASGLTGGRVYAILSNNTTNSYLGIGAEL